MELMGERERVLMVFFFFFCVHGRGVEVDSFLLLPIGVPRGLISWVKGSFFFACVRAMWVYIYLLLSRASRFFFYSCMEHDRYEDEEKQTLLYRTVNMAISYHEREEKGGGC